MRKLPSAAHPDARCLPEIRRGWDLHSRRPLQTASKQSKNSRGMDPRPRTRVCLGRRFSCGFFFFKWLLPTNISAFSQEKKHQDFSHVCLKFWFWSQNESWHGVVILWCFPQMRLQYNYVVINYPCTKVHSLWGANKNMMQPQKAPFLYPFMRPSTGSDGEPVACSCCMSACSFRPLSSVFL